MGNISGIREGFRLWSDQNNSVGLKTEKVLSVSKVTVGTNGRYCSDGKVVLLQVKLQSILSSRAISGKRTKTFLQDGKSREVVLWGQMWKVLKVAWLER